MEENNSFDEFRTNLLKRNTKKDFKIKNSLWSKSLYRSADKSHPIRQVKEVDFLHIIREINNCLADDIIQGHAISIPFIGTFYIRRRELKTAIKDNKVITKRKIDWYRTHKLWYEDDESKEKKTLIRFTNTDTYEVKWSKSKFTNSSFFRFNPHRTLRAKLRQQLKKDNTVYIYGT